MGHLGGRLRSTPTVYDVAEHAGVSIATVSRVYRSPATVRVETRERVLAVARELGYVPSGSARGLASRTTGVLGLCFPDFHDTEAEGAPDADDAELMLYVDEVIRGMERAARRHGYALLIAASVAGGPGQSVSDMAGRVDGLAVLAQTVPEDELDVVARRLPVVMLANPPDRARDHVEVANFDGQLALTRHLIKDHGLRRLAFVGGPEDSPDGEARFRGYQAAHLAAGLPLPDRPDARSDLTQAGGRLAAQALLDRLSPRPQALVFANDQMAVGGLHALGERGLRAPDDIAVTGFDGIPLGRLVTPTLTTVRQPMGQLGEQAVALLLARLADHDRPPEARVLATTLTRRASCGCADR
ncbi:LacI family DNA-binding transcriptional regulator [Streptomyces radicis]|uniref:LacI family transcriptional regulator n=1 Tax=Streptomyces radicis TaxID=1750517 RepID=A0A3A9W1E3_9ACTN|nr:LacI family DNA-binding transcriptional regulator [Streptomyces radicis]RKN07045.1 LacI family transcriptional regulator [Streptomyces radicis]RKN15106.1 LacI family transcriptional regulator [Streptomyces radicis]